MKKVWLEWKHSLALKGFNMINDISYFDYAATTFMPEQVIAVINTYHRSINLAPNRGNNKLSKLANETYENSRVNIRNFFLGENYQLIFYPGASYALNVIAYGLEHILCPMDIILLGPYEHHSNYLPWRELSHRTGAIVFEMPLLEDGSINIEYLDSIKDQIKIVAFSSVANTNGYHIDVSKLKAVLGESVLYVSDDSQKCAHEKIRYNEYADCHIVNSHKMYGPKGLAGALVNEKFLENLSPAIFGGGMIERISYPNIWKDGIAKYECGSIDVGAALGWAEACKHISDIGLNEIEKQEKIWSQIVVDELRKNPDVVIVSEKESVSLVSFYHKSIHAHDVETAFSERNVIVRAGHLCSQNSIAKFKMQPIVRISFGIGVSEYDINQLLQTIREVL